MGWGSDGCLLHRIVVAVPRAWLQHSLGCPAWRPQNPMAARNVNNMAMAAAMGSCTWAAAASRPACIRALTHHGCGRVTNPGACALPGSTTSPLLPAASPICGVRLRAMRPRLHGARPCLACSAQHPSCPRFPCPESWPERSINGRTCSRHTHACACILHYGQARNCFALCRRNCALHAPRRAACRLALPVAAAVMLVCGFVMAWQRFHNDPDMQAAE